MRKTKIGSLFQASPEYYTFVSGALISIPIALLFELSSNYEKIIYWGGLILSVLASFFCFRLSIILKEVHEDYLKNKSALGNSNEAWNGAIKDRLNRCLLNFALIIITLIASILCVCFMQF